MQFPPKASGTLAICGSANVGPVCEVGKLWQCATHGIMHVFFPLSPWDRCAKLTVVVPGVF